MGNGEKGLRTVPFQHMLSWWTENAGGKGQEPSQGEHDMMMTGKIVAFAILGGMGIILTGIPAGAETIRGDACYTSPQEEPITVGKEISYAMALRRAVGNSEAFASVMRDVEDCKARASILEVAAGSCIRDITVTGQAIEGREICTKVTGTLHVPGLQAIKERKLREFGLTQEREFKGLIRDEYVKILNYKKRGSYLTVLYQAKRYLDRESVEISVRCFDEGGTPGKTYDGQFPLRPLLAGEIRWATVRICEDAAFFELTLGRSAGR
jgi:hypothetical protein